MSLLETAVKYDTDKPRMDLLPPNALLQVARVLTFGAKKYDPWNYLKGGGLDEWRLLASTLRHVNAHQRGELSDPESGEPHLAHAASCLLMLLEINSRKETKSNEQDSYHP